MSFSVNSAVGSSEMKLINSWNDVTPFAGSVVAYMTNSCYFKGSKGFDLDNPLTQFSYVNPSISCWSYEEEGYYITRLLKPEEVPGTCALIDSKLKSPILMRRASSNEINLISQAIFAGQAKFEYKNEKDAKRILEQHFFETLKIL